MSSLSIITATQIAVLNQINNISDLKNQSIGIFVSVPVGQKPPYLKINQISLSDQYNEDIGRCTIGFQITIITAGKSNKQMISIFESIRKNLPQIVGSDVGIEILGFSNFSVSMQDDIGQLSWTGNINFSLTVNDHS